MKNENIILETFDKTITNQEYKKISHEKLHTSPIILYGAGYIGKTLYKSLVADGLDVVCFLDKNAKALTSNDVPTHLPETQSIISIPKDALIIITMLATNKVLESIKSDLNNLGFNTVYTLSELDFPERSKTVYQELLFTTKRNPQQMKDAYLLLEDEKSRNAYTEFAKSRIYLDFRYLSQPDDLKKQYFAHDINKHINFNRFVDCGAFNGDVIKTLFNKGIQVEKLAVFEPQNDQLITVSQLLNDSADSFQTATLFPCGVYSQITQMKFSASEQIPASSKIDTNGDYTIQCVAIDDVLKGFNPTCIKMDIEGAELEALKGAEKTIKKHLPQLSICVYHKLEDIWEIPLLIHSFSSRYKFYLRTYYEMGLETVLYAFPE